MRYYLPFRTAIPHLKVDYLRVTHPFATGKQQFLPALKSFHDFSLPNSPAFSLLACPSDLHGSCTPLALILSQDQTLRKLFQASFSLISSVPFPSSVSSATLQLLRCPFRYGLPIIAIVSSLSNPPLAAAERSAAVLESKTDAQLHVGVSRVTTSPIEGAQLSVLFSYSPHRRIKL